MQGTSTDAAFFRNQHTKKACQELIVRALYNVMQAASDAPYRQIKTVVIVPDTKLFINDLFAVNLVAQYIHAQ
jgi:hypothetical protein